MVVKRKFNKHLLYDKIHRVTVTGLMGLTGFSILLLGHQIYTYYAYVRPNKSAERQKMLEAQILKEQHEKEDEYYRLRRERESLKS